MLIDWFTVGAQALNFLILVWLLKRFLYGPVLNAIDAREKRIVAKIEDADTKKSEAQKERGEFRQKNEEFDQQRAALLSQAMDEVKAERLRLLDEVRQEADTVSKKWQEALRNDAKNLNQEIIRRTQEEVFAISRKTLADLSDSSLEERLCEMFIRRLKEMNTQEKADFGKALKTASEPALVRTAFDLPAKQRTAIQAALKETLSSEMKIHFETNPALIGGIELRCSGQKVAWSIEDYLRSLETSLAELQSDPAGEKSDLEKTPKSEALTEGQ